MVKITLVDLIHEEKEHRIPIGITILGRTVENDIKIENDAVSKKHCEVYREENNRLSVRDIGSKNGTYINNNKKRLSKGKKYLLKDGCVLKLCNYEFRIKIEQGEDLEEIDEELSEGLRRLDDSDTEYDLTKDQELEK